MVMVVVVVIGCAHQAAGDDPEDDKIFRVRNVGSSLSDEDKIQVRACLLTGQTVK